MTSLVLSEKYRSTEHLKLYVLVQNVWRMQWVAPTHLAPLRS